MASWIDGAAVVAASRNPNSRHSTACQTLRPMYRQARYTTAPRITTSGIETTTAPSPPPARRAGPTLARGHWPSPVRLLLGLPEAPAEPRTALAAPPHPVFEERSARA